jgi:beta-lactamase regulating signal transducer with metallopeptidase domain
MNRKFNTSDVKANDDDPPFEFTHIEQMLVIIGFLVCVICCLYYIMVRVERKSHLRRRRSGQMRVIPSHKV